ncbi:hypothetical protein [Patulibacter sp. SYSU D01012]|uniref:hypothetical protein n=1 Tax=Patulibacter sp. SYSU D01012 TaxID=2817381 RepID=UPI001B316BDF|nr:hypothetical protein [Patulibacter sp. SYSU D01012]
MGFLGTARRAASAAREGLDALQTSRAQAARVAAPVTAGPDAGDDERVRRGRALGAPDPRELLTAEDAAAIAGTAVGGPRLAAGDDAIGVTYAAAAPDGSRWAVEASAFHAGPGAADWSAARHWDGFLAPLLADEGRPVPGLGDAAIARDGEVYVLAGAHLLRTAVTLPADADAGDPTDGAIEAARRAVARLR